MSTASLRRTALLGAVGGTAFLAALGAVGRANAQTAVPIDVVISNSTGFTSRLGIMVGVDGGPAKEYIFDTGSDRFNIAVGNNPALATWFPSYKGPTATADLQPYLYATDGYLYGPTSISTRSFYAPQGQSPVGGGSFGPYKAGLLPVGAVIYHIDTDKSVGPAVTDNPGLNNEGTPYYEVKAFQTAINSGSAPEEKRFYGIFGAGDFGESSLLGRLTRTGYVVEANGTKATPGACGQACLIMDLTPELRAQFFNVVKYKTDGTTFPISGLRVSEQFGAMFSYVVGNASPALLATMLDSGYVGNEINVAGAQTVTATTNADWNSPDWVTFKRTVTKPGQGIGGLSFYMKNAVMYDLLNTAIGYTPFSSRSTTSTG
jgi:hypothetical protein